jgi:hypothetical protein
MKVYLCFWRKVAEACFCFEGGGVRRRGRGKGGLGGRGEENGDVNGKSKTLYGCPLCIRTGAQNSF